MVQPKEHVSKC